MKACDRHAEHENSVKKARYQVNVLDLEATAEQAMAGEAVTFSGDWCAVCFEEFQRWTRESEPQTAYEVPTLEEHELVPTRVRLDEAEPERQG